MTRTALLVRCNADEADRVRFEAQREGRTISAYVLRASLRAVIKDERLFSEKDYRSPVFKRSPVVPGQRTAILVRCDAAEADRIREAARRRDTRINAFIIQALRSTWDQQMPLRVGSVGAPLTAAPL